MTNRPKLYPGHMHEWTRVGQTSPDMVRCTVCGFQAPRNAAGLDGHAHDEHVHVDFFPPQPEQETR